MMQIIKQNTLRDVRTKRNSLHNGQEVNLIVRPSSPNSGIVFKRIDIDQNNIINANFKKCC